MSNLQCRAINVHRNKMVLDKRRPFKEIHVANFSAQKRQDRFPDLRDEQNAPPKIAHWRSNLTALSQKYNVYFAIYQHSLHCFIPRDLKQRIPSKADLILPLPVSHEAVQVGGYIDTQRPHNANHMILGQLGNLEILLIACDDGDVIGFYTHSVRDELLRVSADSTEFTHTISPFFHQNVGKSAWGLAIHSQSRLIAVSSNLRAITIFAHGLRGKSHDDTFSCCTDSFGEDYFRRFEYPASIKGLFDKREHNFRLNIDFSEDGDNIPSVSFASNGNGDAEHVLAVDISGTLYKVSLKAGLVERVPGMEHVPPSANSTRGWSVLALPLEYFQTVAMPHVAFGSHGALKSTKLYTEGLPAHCFEVSESISDVRDNSSWHPAYQFGISGPASIRTGRSTIDNQAELILEVDGNEDEGSGTFDTIFALLREHGRERELLAIAESSEPTDAEEEYDVSVSLHKAMGELREIDARIFRDILMAPPSVRMGMRTWDVFRKYSNQLSQLREQKLLALPTQSTTVDNQKFAVLRCYGYDIELFSQLRQPAIKTVLRSPLTQSIPEAIGHLQFLDRINLVAVIPELNLVIAGSQVGRVGLLTLTKIEPGHGYRPAALFRLDLILPLKHDEDKYRPPRPLFGIAVSPLQKSSNCWDCDRKSDRDFVVEDEARLNDASWLGGQVKLRRRWRLLLHYYDHTILSYELGREDESDELSVYAQEIQV